MIPFHSKYFYSTNIKYLSFPCHNPVNCRPHRQTSGLDPTVSIDRSIVIAGPILTKVSPKSTCSVVSCFLSGASSSYYLLNYYLIFFVLSKISIEPCLKYEPTNHNVVLIAYRFWWPISPSENVHHVSAHLHVGPKNFFFSYFL